MKSVWLWLSTAEGLALALNSFILLRDLSSENISVILQLGRETCRGRSVPRSGDAEPARAQVRGELGAAPAGSAAGTAGALGLERGSFGQGSFGQGCLRQLSVGERQSGPRAVSEQLSLPRRHHLPLSQGCARGTITASICWWKDLLMWKVWVSDLWVLLIKVWQSRREENLENHTLSYINVGCRTPLLLHAGAKGDSKLNSGVSRQKPAL